MIPHVCGIMYARVMHSLLLVNSTNALVYVASLAKLAVVMVVWSLCR